MAANVAILMAAGMGTRLGADCPKQFLNVGGKMLMEYSLQVFQDHPRIDEVVVVLPEDYLSDEALLGRLFDTYSKVMQVLAGGAERFQSSWSAVQWFADCRDANLLLHDAARPGITPHMVDDLLDALQHAEAAVAAIPATDTIIRADEQGHLRDTLDRHNLYCAQTPQAFRAGLLYDCFVQLIEQSGFLPTDESGLVAHFRPDVPVMIVPGDPRNFKVTYPADVERVRHELLC